MKYVAQIRVQMEDVAKLFEAEDRKIGNRAKYDLRREGDACIFDFEAQDAIALRVALNSVTKILATHENVLEALKDGI